MASLFEPQIKGELLPLRWYQESAIPLLRDAIREGHFHSIGQAPCRWGKTVLAAHIFDSALRKGNNCLFACPRISLVDQAYDSFFSQGLTDIGVMQADSKRTDPNARLQVACFDTLYRRDPQNYGLVIVDEVHLADPRMWELKKRWKIVLGLTATPWSKGLGLHFTKLIPFSTIPQMLEYNARDSTVGLVPVRGKGPNYALLAGLAGVKTGDNGEYQEKPLSAFMDRKEIIADVVETWLKTRQDGSHPGDRTFLFCPTRINARNLQDALFAEGVKFEYIDAFTSERSPIFRRFHNREIQGIASVGCLTTGVDADVRCIIDAAPSRSEITIVQKLMRGGTPSEGKEYYWLNDHAGNANRFGWFADIFHDELDTTPPQVKGSAYENEEQAPRERKRRECERCREILKIGALKCHVCGLASVVDDVVTINAKLTDLVPTKGSKPAKKPRQERSEEQAFYSGLLDFAQRRGWSDGWAAHKFREKFGVFPRNLERVPMTPRKAVKEFIAEEARKYRKSKKAAPQPPQEEYRGEF